MRAESPTRTISGVMGLTAFTLALIAGWAAHNPLDTVLTRAIVAMVLCYAVGQILGWAATRVVREHLADYRAANPVPVSPGAPASAGPADEHAQIPRDPRRPNTTTTEPEQSRAAA